MFPITASSRHLFSKVGNIFVKESLAVDRGQYLASVKVHLPRICRQRIYVFLIIFSMHGSLQTQGYPIDLWPSQMFFRRLFILTWTLDIKKG